MSNLAVVTPEQQAALARLTGAQRPSLAVRSACELAAAPLPEWRVKGVLPRHGVALMYGPPGCGKSFLGLDLGFAVASGRDWFGSRVASCPVLYIAAEAGASMGSRINAHFQRLPGEDEVPVAFITEPVDLFHGLDLRQVIEAAKQHAAGLIVVDTLARATAGADENTPGDMSQIVANLAELAREAEALVLAIHHAGKDATRGPRGHTALIAAVDASIEVTRDLTGMRAWKLAKSRDGQDGIEHVFKLRPVPVAEDADGDAVSSCYVEAEVQDELPRGPRRAPLSGKNERAVMSILAELCRNSRRFGEAGAPAGRPVVDLEDLIEATKGRIAVEPKRHRERVMIATNGLLDKGHVAMREGVLWIV